MELHPRVKKILKTQGKSGDDLIARCEASGNAYDPFYGKDIFKLCVTAGKLAMYIDYLEQQLDDSKGDDNENL